MVIGVMLLLELAFLLYCWYQDFHAEIKPRWGRFPLLSGQHLLAPVLFHKFIMATRSLGSKSLEESAHMASNSETILAFSTGSEHMPRSYRHGTNYWPINPTRWWMFYISYCCQISDSLLSSSFSCLVAKASD